MANETNYNIFKDFLESINYSTPTDLDTFKEGKKIIYECNNGHQSSANVDTFRSKKKKCMEQESVLCVKCVGKKAGRPKGSNDASLDSAYNTYKRFLESIGYKITINFEQFNQSSTKDTSRRVTFVCNGGHETEVSSAVFNRKKREREKNGTLLCNDCTGRGKAKDVDTKLEELRKVVFEMNGHHVMAINGTTVTHKCGLCEEVNESWESNIRSKTTLHCRKCKDTDVALEASCSRPVKKPEFGMGVFMNFEKYLEEHGYEMVSDFEEFQKNSMAFKCREGHVTPMKVTSFNNRKHSDLIKNDTERLCHDCNGDCNVSYAKKPFVFPSGRVDKVMGYEPRCLEELLKTYDENDIVTDRKKLPVFKYDKEKDGKNYEGTYYPDIMVQDKIIEVKSKYVYKLDEENNLKKFNAVTYKGHDLECWIYDKDDLNILKFPKTNNRSRMFHLYGDFLSDIGYVMLSDFESFNNEQIISYRCDKGHVSKNAISSFGNKKTCFKHGTILCICQECSETDRFDEHFNALKITVFERTGHEILTLKTDRSLTYKCGTCGEINSNWENNLKRDVTSKKCQACYSQKKKNVGCVQKSINDLGIDYVLLEYLDNKHVTWRCPKSHIFTMPVSDLKRGRRCMLCKKEDTPKKYKQPSKQKVTPEDKLESLKKFVIETSGHEILTLEQNGNLTYRCGYCGEICSSYEGNFKRTSSKNCINCAQKSKKKDKEANEFVQNLGIDYTMLEYTDNKHIQWQCSNGHIFNMAMADLKRGRRCASCRKQPSKI